MNGKQTKKMAHSATGAAEAWRRLWTPGPTAAARERWRDSDGRRYAPAAEDMGDQDGEVWVCWLARSGAWPAPGGTVVLWAMGGETRQRTAVVVAHSFRGPRQRRGWVTLKFR